jgi:hypothetical protein
MIACELESALMRLGLLGSGIDDSRIRALKSTAASS